MTAPYPPSSYDVLVFEHIPKTAGSTLRTVLRRLYGRGLFLHTNVRAPLGRFEELQEEVRSGRRPIRAIGSHVGYGLHERLPGALRYAHFTLLRDPIQRTISDYYYGLQEGQIEEGVTLLEAISLDSPRAIPLRAWNVQTAFLGGLRAEYLLDGRRRTSTRSPPSGSSSGSTRACCCSGARSGGPSARSGTSPRTWGGGGRSGRR
jgi:hypothetical protein